MVAKMISNVLVPPFIRRRRSECIGAGLVLLGAALAMALLSYHPADPSWNQVSAEPVRNALGVFGATLADVLQQTLGVMSALLVVACFSWAWRLLHNDTPLRWGWRLVALLLALIGGSTLLALAATQISASWLQHISGAIGVVVAFKLLPLLSFWGVLAVSALLLAVMMPLALGLKSDEWLAISLLLRRAALTVVEGARAFIALLRRPRAEEEEEDEEIEEEEEAELDEEAEEEDDEEELLPPLVTRPKRVEAKKPSKGKTQTSLDLAARTGHYTMPSITMLEKPSAKGAPKPQSEAALEQNARLLESVLKDFGVVGEITKVRPGPVVTLY
ncbi:MAG: hypothetical protein B7X02_01760, partial [Rhodospirillales bacterium 12-54-5]